MHTHMHTHAYTHRIHASHTRIHAYTHTRIHAYTHTRIHAYTRKQAQQTQPAAQQTPARSPASTVLGQPPAYTAAMRAGDSLELSHLPAETIIAIFGVLPSFTDAYSLAAVSKRLRAVFLESSISILKSIASHSRDLSLAGRQLLRAQALIIVGASARQHARVAAYSGLVHGFIEAEVYSVSRSPLDSPYGKRFTPANVPALQANWRVVSALEPAILSQVQAAKPFLETFGMWKDSYAIPSTVTWQDRTRIHNALYRLWTYQALFYHSDYRLPAHAAHGDPGEEASLIRSHQIPMPPNIRYLTSTTFSSDGIELHETLLLWTSIVHNRLFTLTHFSLAIEVAMGAAVLVDHQGRPASQAQGRLYRPATPSIVSRPRLPPRGPVVSPRRVVATTEIIAVVTFLNQWPTNQWTMPRHEERIPAFLTGLVRMLAPPDMLLFLNPSPRAPVSYAAIRRLAERIQAKFDSWEDPATGGATMERWLNAWYKFPMYEAWGSFLFGLEGTKAAFFEDWRGLPLFRAEGLLWEEDLRWSVEHGSVTWQSKRWTASRQELWKEEWDRFYVR
ncbi:hypothetical protein EV426DRAFT_577834 [Tirmania nivea]|nr:hypothetical protein EV426DRAFT_577834 [Tirmania nivea]